MFVVITHGETEAERFYELRLNRLRIDYFCTAEAAGVAIERLKVLLEEHATAAKHLTNGVRELTSSDLDAA